MKKSIYRPFPICNGLRPTTNSRLFHTQNLLLRKPRTAAALIYHKVAKIALSIYRPTDWTL